MKISADFFERIWPLSNVQIGETLKEIKDGRTIGRLESNEGSYIFRIADPSKKEASLDKELTAFAFLPEHGFSAVTKILKTRNGKLYTSYEDRLVYLLEYIDGAHPEANPDTYKKLGTLVAQLHAIKGFLYNSDFNADFVVENHLADRAEGLAFKDEFLQLADKLPKFNDFPHALIHTDIGPQNTIQKKNGELILIDWDDVGNGPAILDVGSLLINQFVSEDCVFLKENAQAFYGAYFSAHPMIEAEKQRIFDVGVFLALDYIVYGDVEKRWKRIQWAVANRGLIEEVLK